MRTMLLPALAAALLAAAPSAGQSPDPAPPPSPSEIVEGSAAADWWPVAPENLLVMRLVDGSEILIELAPQFAPVHVENMRRLARAHWYDGTSINRVQDNYVVQWGDATEAKPLPGDIVAAPPAEYDFPLDHAALLRFRAVDEGHYAARSGYLDGWPVGVDPEDEDSWSGALVHCYAMVGVGRGDNPDTGTGAELYTVIGHAPRHLDRNIALVGRVISGIEALSSLPRGGGPLGFYLDDADQVPIASVRLASALPEDERPHYEVLRTDGETFRRYVAARANRSSWFVRPAGAVDVCNVGLPIRRAAD